MINKDQKRNLLFLGITLIIGVLVIGGMLLSESAIPNGQGGGSPPDGGPIFKKLETKINDLKSNKFDPSCFNSIKTEIDSDYDSNLFDISSKSYLTKKLSSVYSDLVYNECELFLSKDIGSNESISSLLNHLESITSNNSRIVYFKNQIKWYNYYTKTLPNKVYAYISSGITNYDQYKNEKFKQEVNEMPYFDSKYKNRSKFIMIKNKLNKDLADFSFDWQQYQ